MKFSLMALTIIFGWGWAPPAVAQGTQFILGNFSDNVRLSVISYAPVPRVDRYDYPSQGFYHYYALPGLAGETNYNPVSYDIKPEAIGELQFEFPEEGNFLY